MAAHVDRLKDFICLIRQLIHILCQISLTFSTNYFIERKLEDQHVPKDWLHTY